MPPSFEDLNLSQLPSSFYDGRLIDLHDLVVVLNFVRANLNPYFRDTKLVELTKTNFESTKLPRNIERKWASADPTQKVGMVFDIQMDEVEENEDDDEWSPDIPKYLTPSTMVKQPPPPSLSTFTPQQLEAIYWQAQNYGGSTITTKLIKCLFSTWRDPPLFLRVRVPPSQGQPRMEYITYWPSSLSSIEFNIKNPKQLSVTVTPSKTFVNGTKGEEPYSVIGFAPTRTVSSDPGPVDVVLDLSSMQHGDVGRAFKHPFVLTRKEEYVGTYLPQFCESNTFSRATYSQITRNRANPLGESFDDEIKDIAHRAREYCMMKVRHKAAYCAYCGMPEMVEAGLYSTGGPMDRCSVCKIEYYCSGEHQKNAWSYHKHFCNPLSSSDPAAY